MSQTKSPQVPSNDLVTGIYRKILSMTNRDEDQDVPTSRGIEMVLQAMSDMPELNASWVDQPATQS